MYQTVNLATWPSSSTSGTSLEMSIQNLSANFGLIKFPNGAKAILSELKKCFAALLAIFPRISTESVELLIRLTICALQTQTTLDHDLRQIICRGTTFLHDKRLVQELLQETDPQTLAQNSQWIQILQQQNLQHLQSKDGQSFERISFSLENAAKFVAMAPEAAAVFHNVALPPFLLFKEENSNITAASLQDSAKTVVFSPKLLDSSTTSTKMVGEIAAPERLFTCDFCQKTFSLRKSFVKHMRTHTGEKPFACSFCDKSFSHKSTLEDHERIHTGERPYKCTICPKTFISSSALVKHTRTHTGENPFACRVCHKGFTQPVNLKAHFMVHTGEKPYTCKFCKKSFSLLGNLKKHERIHTGERPFKCNLCPKMFSQSESLVVHTRTHTGEKPFVCSVCHRGFAKSSALKTHFRTHTGEKPYTCDICNKSFSEKGNLNRHKRIHTRKAPDLQGSPSGRDGVPNAFSVSPSKQSSAMLICNLPEQLTAMDLSKPKSHG